MTIDKNKDLFLQLSSTLCDDEDYHSGDEDCWTGTHYGDYTHEVVSTTSQKYNPEVQFSSVTTTDQFPRDSRLQMLIDRLINLKNAATKAVSSNAYRSDSDKMLSDMAEGSGNHYEPDYDSTEDEYGENGSGSGEGPGSSKSYGAGIINVARDSNFTPTVNPSLSPRISACNVVVLTLAALCLSILSSSSRSH
ncbi:division abnormally delayed protein [Uranotaenia lowii]|uniref:division abnormally delayed protein n=1 Tax=Uranotaenia lowii TaxID=190385 RepID=UPI00247A3FC2|nr:division abnormally delayed protein [Uranotaenia lowii]